VTTPGLPVDVRFFMKVDKTDGCWEWTAGKDGRGYGGFYLDGKIELAHRVSYRLAYGSIPDGKHLDHICWNPGCVRPDHLRPVTPKQNHENRKGVPSHNTSGFRGVSWSEKSKAWIAYVIHDGKHCSAGTFSTRYEAAEAARQLRLSLYTHNDADRKKA
jgi:hypothetical protein